MTKKVLWILFATFAIIIGLYPAIYFILDKKFGLLGTKDDELIGNLIWNIAFYTHIILGGVALLIGWIQFSTKIRVKHLKFHRKVGAIYIIAVLLSALASLYIGVFATGGFFTALGFISLGLIWFTTTLSSFIYIRKGNVVLHEKMMIYSYAACFAAVTLRIWLPILIIIFGEFMIAYQIVAWLCWIPNLLVAMLIIKKIKRQQISTNIRA